MVNPRGTLTLNGITDQELVKLLEIKVGHESSLSFDPQKMQGQNFQQGPSNAMQVYSNVVLGWANEDGLDAIQTIIRTLLNKEETKTKAVGQ